MAKKLFQVVKGSGEVEFFQPSKLLGSLRRAGVKYDLAERIVDRVESELQDGMQTADIYRFAFDLLRDNTPAVAARYDLKRAILRLGPSGYPFEQFVSQIWQHLGYKVQTGVMVPGRCIEHEVDVVAENADEILMMECKYHNFHDTKSDVKTALYVHARMEDLRIRFEKKHRYSRKAFKGFLVTNTKFSSAALKYAKCVGLNVISWSYPKGQGLANIIDKVGLHPITCLTSLSTRQAKMLLNAGCVLCRDLPRGLNSLRMRKKQREELIQEAHELCGLNLN